MALKRSSREFSVFSMSALDIFASAMGTFILMAVVLFPYYTKNQDPVRKMRQQGESIEALKKRIATADAKTKAATEKAAKAKAAAAKARREARAIAQGGGPMRMPSNVKEPNSVQFAIGCWQTEPFRHSARHKPGVSQYCFDKRGQGNLLFYRDGERMMCATYASIVRNGSTITIRDQNSRCNIGHSDKGPWTADRLVCRPDAQGVILCQGQSGNRRWQVRLFRR